jgi:hypothetical protein
MFTLARELDLFPASLVTANTTNNGKRLSFTLFLCPYVDAQPPQRAEEQKPLKTTGGLLPTKSL